MKRAAYALGALALAAALVLLLLPLFIDRPAIQAEIQRRLSEALQGQVAWEALEVALLPVPHGEVRKLRVDIPGKLAASADDVNVYLRFWPLLLGRPEVSSLTLKKPVIRVQAGGGGGDTERPDAAAAYRAAMEPAARALLQFAPEMAFKLEDATVEVGEDFALRDLRALARTDAKGVELELSTAGNLWKRLSIDARLEYADLSARAAIALDTALRAKLRTDGKSVIQGDLEVDLAQVLALARQKAPGLDLLESAQGRLSAKADFSLDKSWRLGLDITRSDAAVRLAPLPWPLSARTATVAITPERVRVTGLDGALGDSSFSDVTLQVELAKPARLSAGSGRATLDLGQWFPWLQGKLPLEELSSISGRADVTLNRLALAFDKPAAADFEAVVAPRKVSAALKALPAPVGIEGGSVRARPKEITLENIAVAMLDARARVSGNVGIAKPGLELALAEGVAGEKAVQWALGRGGVPERFEPKTPLRFAAKRIAWAPQGTLAAEAQVALDGGPQVALALAAKPGLLELPGVAIKDASSDAVLGLMVQGDTVRASFAGTLHGRTIAAMLRRPGPETASGSAQGKFRVTIDRAQPRRTVAEGRLRIDALDLSWLAGKRAIIQHIDLTAEPENARLVDAKVDWQEQVIELRGEMKRTAQGPVIDARLESPGVVLEKLLPEPKKEQKAEKSSLWPLPVTGRVQVSSGFVQYKERRVAPLQGTLSLERERARLEVKEARMCGVSFPLELEAVPEKIAVSAHISMRDEPFDTAMHCLTGGGVDITGKADVIAELKSEGRPADLVRNLAGSVQAEVRNGAVKRFALIGNILSLRNIASVSEMKEGGFPYRRMSAKGHFEAGSFMLEEGFFDSDAVRLGAHGKVDLQGADSRLTVLVGLLTNVDRVTGAIPLVGYVFGGSMTALPVAVTGDIRNPLVVPLGPRAITDSLLGIFERTLSLPGKLAVPPAEGKPPQ